MASSYWRDRELQLALTPCLHFYKHGVSDGAGYFPDSLSACGLRAYRPQLQRALQARRLAWD